MDSAWRDLTDLLARAPRVEFTFLGETVFFADVPLRERRSWEWGDRLSQSGLQRIQFDKTVTREGFDGFVDDVVSRLSPGGSTASARQVARDGIQSGSVASSQRVQPGPRRRHACRGSGPALFDARGSGNGPLAPG